MPVNPPSVRPHDPDPTEAVPRGTLPADRLAAVLRRLEEGHYGSVEVRQRIAEQALVELLREPDGPPE